MTSIEASPLQEIERRVQTRAKETSLDMAGDGLEDLSLGEFVTVMAVLFVVGTGLTFALLGAILPALAVGGFAATYPAGSYRARRHQPRTRAADVRPGQGNVSRDLARVCGRFRQGFTEIEALREWDDVADVEALHRLLPILALNREAADLGRLISEEARSIRKDTQRRLIETAERRAQQVWIPVTVAALVPGVIFLAVPFLEALRLFAGP